MPRVSHPNMKPGQRKYRRHTESEQWLADMIAIANARSYRDQAAKDPSTDPLWLANLDRLITEAETKMNERNA